MPPLHLYEQIRRNKRNSILLIISMIVLLVGIGYVFGSTYNDPWIGVGVAGAFSIFYALISYFAGDGIVLLSLQAKPIEKQDHPQLYNVVEEMAIASGLPMPEIYLIHSPASNAFATGRNPQKAAIGITTGLLEILNREELQAVVAHEMGHIKNYDTRFAILMAVIVGAVALLCDLFWHIRLRTRSSSSKNDNNQIQLILFVVAIVFSILAPIAAKIIQFSVSRKREYLADQTSAELTRNPEALARALEKIATDPDPLDLKNRGAQHLFIANPLKSHEALKEEKAGWFDTHPPLGTRIKILREMAHTFSPSA